MYPDLRAEALQLRIGGSVYRTGPWLQEFGIQVAKVQGHLRERPGPEALADSFFTASFAYDNQGLVRFGAHGRFVNYSPNDSFGKALRQRATWSDAQISAELDRLGARYSAAHRDDVLQVVPPAQVVAEVAGTEPLGLTNVEFVISSPHDRKGGVGAESVTWKLTYRPASGNPSFAYVAFAETFEGRVTGLFRDEAVR